MIHRKQADIAVASDKAWFRELRFINSVNALQQLPADDGSEVVFVGRSNSGKSSVLNVLAGQKQLARTSKQPGRTQYINIFAGGQGRLIDLPGYGYAKAPNTLREHWQHLLGGYLSIRSSLKGMLLIMDIRHPMTPLDIIMLEWCTTAQLPVHILLNKADKLSRGAAQNTLVTLQSTTHAAALSMQLFSAAKRLGIIEAQQKINSWMAV